MLALAGIRRLVVHTKAIETDDMLGLSGHAGRADDQGGSHPYLISSGSASRGNLTPIEIGVGCGTCTEDARMACAASLAGTPSGSATICV